MVNRKVEKVWQDFWMPLVAPDGRVDMEQIKKELYDFRQIMKEVSRVYEYVTGGAISKINTKAEEVIIIYKERTQSLVNEMVKEAIEEEVK